MKPSPARRTPSRCSAVLTTTRVIRSVLRRWQDFGAAPSVRDAPYGRESPIGGEQRKSKQRLRSLLLEAVEHAPDVPVQARAWLALAGRYRVLEVPVVDLCGHRGERGRPGMASDTGPPRVVRRRVVPGLERREQVSE